MKSYEFQHRKHYLILILLVPLLCFFTFIEVILIKKFNLSDFKAILIVPIFSLYLLFVYRMLFWTLFGKEQVQITSEDLIIRKVGTILVKPEAFALRKIKNIRIINIKFSYTNFIVSRTSLTSLKSYGCIVFDYENRTINFGGNINDSNVNEIITTLEDCSASAKRSS
jgi:hypothetical protein